MNNFDEWNMGVGEELFKCDEPQGIRQKNAQKIVFLLI